MPSCSFLSAEELARARELGEGVEWILEKAEGHIASLSAQLQDANAERDADRVNSGTLPSRVPT